MNNGKTLANLQILTHIAIFWQILYLSLLNTINWYNYINKSMLINNFNFQGKGTWNFKCTLFLKQHILCLPQGGSRCLWIIVLFLRTLLGWENNLLLFTTVICLEGMHFCRLVFYNIPWIFWMLSVSYVSLKTLVVFSKI